MKIQLVTDADLHRINSLTIYKSDWLFPAFQLTISDASM